MRGVVTVSAAFGAGGSEIGPAVARALELPFVDRAIPAAVSRKLGISLADAEEQDEKVDTGLWRIVSSMAFVPDLGGAGALAQSALTDERLFQQQTEQVLHEVAERQGGVVLGRAGAIVLADVEPALHVRLTGGVQARIAGHMARTGVDRKTAEHEVRSNDSAREAYVKHLYRCDATDSKHYHLVIDTTSLPWDVVTDIIVTAARARGVHADDDWARGTTSHAS